MIANGGKTIINDSMRLIIQPQFDLLTFLRSMFLSAYSLSCGYQISFGHNEIKWTLVEETEKRIRAFEIKCIRKLLCIPGVHLEHRTNAYVWKYVDIIVVPGNLS